MALFRFHVAKRGLTVGVGGSKVELCTFTIYSEISCSKLTYGTVIIPIYMYKYDMQHLPCFYSNWCASDWISCAKLTTCSIRHTPLHLDWSATHRLCAVLSHKTLRIILILERSVGHSLKSAAGCRIRCELASFSAYSLQLAFFVTVLAKLNSFTTTEGNCYILHRPRATLAIDVISWMLWVIIID